MSPMSGYLLVEVEEIIKETDTAFLLRYATGAQEWLLKIEVMCPMKYRLGDRNVTIQLKEN